MTKTYLIIAFLLINLAVIAQKHTVEVTNTKTDIALVIKAKNSNNTQYELTLTVNQQNLKGYSKPITKLIPANSEIEIATLYYIKGKRWSYKSSYTYKEKPTSQEIALQRSRIEEKSAKEAALQRIKLQEKAVKEVGDIKKGIVVFSKDGCTRCHYVTSYMLDNNIDFKFLNTTENKDYKKLMWQLLRENDPSGTNLKRILMPVVLVNGEISHTMKDLKAFVSSLNK